MGRPERWSENPVGESVILECCGGRRPKPPLVSMQYLGRRHEAQRRRQDLSALKRVVVSVGSLYWAFLPSVRRVVCVVADLSRGLAP